MREVPIDGHQYRIPRLPAMPQQFALARKLSGVLALLALQDDKEKIADKFPTAFCALTENLSEEDVAFIMGTCLSDVTRQETGGAVWAPIWVGGRSQYQDMELATILRVVWSVLVENNLVSFFSGTLSTSDAKKPASDGSTTRTDG